MATNTQAPGSAPQKFTQEYFEEMIDLLKKEQQEDNKNQALVFLNEGWVVKVYKLPAEVIRYGQTVYYLNQKMK